MGQTSIPKEQPAHVLEQLGRLPELKTIPVKTPGPDEILVRIVYSGVCHSDVHAVKGDWPSPPQNLPLVGGHEGVGEVVAKGADVHNFDIGDYAGIKWISGVCGACYYCQTGSEPLCAGAQLGGYTVDGSFQKYAITKANAGNKLPRDCDLAGLAPVMCAGLTVYRGLKESGARAGQHVVIVGAAGGLGCFALQYARAMGFIPIAVDGGSDKGKVCHETGAAHYIDFKASKDVIADLKAATPDGLGAHAAVIVSSEEDPFTHASDFVRPLGTVVIVGIPTDGYIKSQIFDMVVRDVTIKGSLVGSRYDLEEAVEFYRRGLIKVPYKVVGFDKLKDVIEPLDHNKVVGRYVLDVGSY